MMKTLLSFTWNIVSKTAYHEVQTNWVFQENSLGHIKVGIDSVTEI